MDLRYRRIANRIANDRKLMCLPDQRRRSGPGASCQMAMEQRSQDGDGLLEVVAEGHEQVDVVEVFLAAEAVGEVVAWVDGGEHFLAMGTKKAVATFARVSLYPIKIFS